MTRYLIPLALWLAVVGQTGIVVGHGMKAPEALPPYRLRVLTVEMMIVDAAMRHGISPKRALNRAWSESKYRDIDSACCRSVFQLHRKLWPAMSVPEGIDAGVRHLAELIRRYGPLAERVYRRGHV